MGEQFPGYRQDVFQEHYERPEAPIDVLKRQLVYWCTEGRIAGEPAIDLEIEAHKALTHAGVPATATIMDVGCSFPNFLNYWKLMGHTGRLIGVEPNTKQFEGQLSYWRPVATLPGQRGGNAGKSIYELVGNTAKPGFEGVEMFASTVDSLPLHDGEVDVLTSMFMFYHVPRDVQPFALQEIKRQLKPETGIFVLATRGFDNKSGIRANEARIAQALSRMRGEWISPPPPVNSGFTSEDARKILPAYFPEVREYNHRDRLLFRYAPDAQIEGADILQGAYYTLRAMYKNSGGESVSDEEFEFAFREVLGTDIDGVRTGKNVIRDTLDESLFIASDRPLNLPSRPAFEAIS